MISVFLGNRYLNQKYEEVLVLNRESLDIICAPSIGEEQNAIFEQVYYAVRYIFNEAKLTKG